MRKSKRLVKAKGYDPENISITPNYNTLKSRITLADLRDENKSSQSLSGNLRSVLGFNSKLFSKNGQHHGHQQRCDSMQSNRQLVHQRITDLHRTFVQSHCPTVPPGYLMNVQPRNLIYLPLNRQSMISQITIRITDQSGSQVNLNGERTTFYISLMEQK